MRSRKWYKITNPAKEAPLNALCESTGQIARAKMAAAGHVCWDKECGDLEKIGQGLGWLQLVEAAPRANSRFGAGQDDATTALTAVLAWLAPLVLEPESEPIGCLPASGGVWEKAPLSRAESSAHSLSSTVVAGSPCGEDACEDGGGGKVEWDGGAEVECALRPHKKARVQEQKLQEDAFGTCPSGV